MSPVRFTNKIFIYFLGNKTNQAWFTETNRDLYEVGKFLIKARRSFQEKPNLEIATQGVYRRKEATTLRRTNATVLRNFKSPKKKTFEIMWSVAGRNATRRIWRRARNKETTNNVRKNHAIGHVDIYIYILHDIYICL